MHFLITCTRYIRVALAVLGCALITLYYIIHARRVGHLLTGDSLVQAAARLPAEWASTNRWWLQLTLNCRTQVYGLQEELIQRMRAGPVFVLGNHPSMAELFWAIDFYGSTIGHVLGIVSKEELRNSSLGKGMSAIGIGWFIPREKGREAVAVIRECAQQAINRFERFCAVIYVDGTKPTTQNILLTSNRFKPFTQHGIALRQYANHLRCRFQTTCPPKIAGAGATIEAARSAENATVLYVSIRSPRHVADLMAFRSTRLCRVLRFIHPIRTQKLIERMSFVYDLLRQAYALCSESVEIRVEELDVHSAGALSYIGSRTRTSDTNLHLVPPVEERERFATWLLKRAWDTDQWVAEQSNCARPSSTEVQQGEFKESSM